MIMLSRIMLLLMLFGMSLYYAVRALHELQYEAYLSAGRWYFMSHYTFIFACALMVYVLVDFSIQKNRKRSDHQDDS